MAEGPDYLLVTDPTHYDVQVNGVSCEVYDIQRAFLSRWDLDLYAGHCLANALKYLFRCGHKGNRAQSIADLGKALFYVALALAEINSGRLPIQLVEKLRRMTVEFPEREQPSKQSRKDFFEPVINCKDGFCPIPGYSVLGDDPDTPCK
jgi:hypothetical protein